MRKFDKSPTVGRPMAIPPKSRREKVESAASARAAAVYQLNRIEQEGAFVGFVSEDELVSGLDARAERQATDYVAGITRWQRWLDFLIAHFYRGRFDKMEPTLRQVLRVGLYDLLFLNTPPHAALHEAVELAKRMVRPGAGGLVNGILRNVLRRRAALPRPEADDPAEALAVRHSHPTWIVQRWLERYGPAETEALLAWNNARPVYGLRINLLKTTVEAFHEQLRSLEEVEWEASPYLDDFVRLRQLQPVLRAGLVEEGMAAVQDESAGLIVRLLDPQPGEVVLDLAAAPGGKATHAAARMQNRGRLLAFDVHEGRLGLVDEAARAQGIEIIETAVADVRDLPRRAGLPAADRVLLDAPCSGLGVLSKRADLRWKRTLEEVHHLAALQSELLDAAAALVRPGGLLVYSTCTIEPKENQARVAVFLKTHPDFSVESAAGFVPPEMVTPEGYYGTFPPRHHVDGAFGVRLRRTG